MQFELSAILVLFYIKKKQLFDNTMLFNHLSLMIFNMYVYNKNQLIYVNVICQLNLLIAKYRMHEILNFIK